MHIGLIGGIGPAATDFYYRRLIEAFRIRAAALDLTIAHADSPTLLRNLANNAVEDQVAIFTRLTDRLAAAGAGCVAVTSIAGHFCIQPFKAASRLPVIDLLAAVRTAVEARGLSRVGVLGTRTVMATAFYGGLPGVTVIAPAGEALDAVHDAYVAMAAKGVATDAQRAVLNDARRQLLEDAGAEAILLGGTDLTLVFDAATTNLPLVDCAALHVDAIVQASAD